ncbi:permease [Paenibacillus sp. YN15]|uniref:permease n=1 Tax=Paenibacillus sp. YN15 TaxID=1742774 RepID=UPI000DCB626E|nr:permease [Paenibacillus sp. YN15]RAV06311.1 permease [Paenibacillus sp. YN15]
MQAAFLRWAPPALGLASCALLILIAATRPLPDWSVLLPILSGPFGNIFLGIILDALPFMLMGVILSSILHLAVPEHVIRRLVPKNPVLGIMFACSLGLLFPVCECGMVPIVRRLMNKGMPVYMAAVFLLAGPVLNPVAFASTLMAFGPMREMAYARMGLAFAAAALTGLCLYRYAVGSPLRHSLAGQRGEHVHSHRSFLEGVLRHGSDEFFEMGKFLILGAGVTALVQTLVSPASLSAIGHGGLSAHLFMAGLAYVLSLCSSSDAFVAASFLPAFSKSSLLTFLVLGPMIDFKGTLMLLSVFKIRFVLILSLIAGAAIIGGALVLDWFSSIF